MEIRKEQIQELMDIKFFVHLALIGEMFDDYVEQGGGDKGELMDSYLDYLNDNTIPESERVDYPRFCFMSMAKVILTMQIDGKLNIR